MGPVLVSPKHGCPLRLPPLETSSDPLKHHEIHCCDLRVADWGGGRKRVEETRSFWASKQLTAYFLTAVSQILLSVQARNPIEKKLCTNEADDIMHSSLSEAP